MTTYLGDSSFLLRGEWVELPDGTYRGLSVGLQAIGGGFTQYSGTLRILSEGGTTSATGITSPTITASFPTATGSAGGVSGIDFDMAVNRLGLIAVSHGFGLNSAMTQLSNFQVTFLDATGRVVNGASVAIGAGVGMFGSDVASSLTTGETVAVWSQGGAIDGDGYAVMLRRFDVLGNQIGTDLRVNTLTAGDQVRPDVSFRADGTLQLSYLSQQAGNDRYIVDFLSATGASVAPRLLVSSSAHDAGNGSSAVLTGGNTAFVYENLATNIIYLRVIDSTGAIVGVLREVNLPAARGIAEMPGVGALPDGGFVVVWREDFNPTQDQYVYRLFNADGTARSAQVYTGETVLATSLNATEVNVLPSGAFQFATRYYGAPTDASDYLVLSVAGTIDGLKGADIIEGSSGSDVIHGGADFDSLYGGGGNDAIYGGTTNFDITDLGRTQYLDGGAGDDLIESTDIAVIYGGNGNDTIRGSNRDPDPQTGATVADSIYGGDGDDVIRALGGDDFIDGGAGNDIIFGGFGRETVFGGAGNDRIVLAADTEFASGVLYGGIGNDILRGANSADTIYGGDGNDNIIGGAGSDDLYGGLGTDRFVFTTPPFGSSPIPGDGDRVIYDFENGVDRLVFSVAVVPSFSLLNWTRIGNDVVIGFGDGVSITVRGLGPSFDATDLQLV